ncbi:MAG TPA: hypothetical protein VMY88_05915 [Acidimicrobiales bacterium]|nr:hypothetical protein [Acidimicrobiales bacterium]
MRRKLTTLVALLLLVVAGACGKDGGTAGTVEDKDTAVDGEQLTRAEFLERGDAICGELEVAVSLVESPQSQEDFAHYLTEIRGPVEAARESWELLVPPDDGQDVHQALLDSLTEGLEALNGAITAAESGDTVTAEDLLSEADRAGDEVDAQAQAYGFEECGKDDADEESGGAADDQPLPEEEDPQPNDPPRDDEPLPEEQDPAPVDDPPAERQEGDPHP